MHQLIRIVRKAVKPQKVLGYNFSYKERREKHEKELEKSSFRSVSMFNDFAKRRHISHDSIGANDRISRHIKSAASEQYAAFSTEKSG